MTHALSFAAFFRAIHGHEPFPWQIRCAERLVRRSTFAVAVPTGLGKSALVDAAIWAAGLGAWRRIAFVVDRRIVVDAVFERAQRIAEKLQSSLDPELQDFALRLGELQIVRLRGGVHGDDDWVLYPDRVTVVLSTIDQIGSRLLFRGYGVSPRRWPLHAGFMASNSLIIVDEAHLSHPFLQTLETLRGLGADLSVVPMSATLPGAISTDALVLGNDDLALAPVQQRLQARKLARLIEVGNEAEFMASALEQTQALAGQNGIKRIAVVVNRVATARKCFERLRKAGLVCELITGRARQIDRDQQLKTLLPQVGAGRVRSPNEELLVVVATQTIEVGADFDFDALVTECAPLSALRQRFGRLDRLGERALSQAVILRRRSSKADDLVYGRALAQAWDWLQALALESNGVVDFGLAALDEALARVAAPAEPTVHAATLLPVHMDMLAQTGAFAPRLDVGAWLHGRNDSAPDLSIVWRDDLDADQPEDWASAVALLPPMSREALALPAPAVRRWLTGEKEAGLWGDLGAVPDDDAVGPSSQRPVLRWRGADDCAVIPAASIRPGDTLILPASYGGCDAWGWAPESSQPVSDVADLCLADRLDNGTGQRLALRLTTGHWAAFGPSAQALQEQVIALKKQEADALNDAYDVSGSTVDLAFEALIDAVLSSAHPLAARLHRPRLDTHPNGYVVRGWGLEDIEGSLETGQPIALDVHLGDVERFGLRLSAGHAEQAAIGQAGKEHDTGKSYPPMQAMLHGSAISAAGGPLLAKSALKGRDAQLAAWAASGMPRHFRHEFASLDLTPQDNPLIRHLIATHHGQGRPWLTPCQDSHAPGAHYAHLGSHWLQSWADMSARWSAWALAEMEWLLRAADARASIEEAEQAGDDHDAR